MFQNILYVCGLFIPIMYISLYVLGGALRPGYNHIKDSVSELLTPVAPNKSILSVVQIIYALLHILFGIGIFVFIRKMIFHGLTGTIGAWMIIGVGVATIGTAIYPQDAAGTPETFAGKIHKILVFGILIPFSLLSTLMIGIWTKQADIFSGFNIYSYITVVLIMISGMIGGSMVKTPYAGLTERISALIVHQWLFFLAVKLLST